MLFYFVAIQTFKQDGNKSRSPSLFFSALEELIESDFSSTNEKMLPIVSKFFSKHRKTTSSKNSPVCRVYCTQLL